MKTKTYTIHIFLFVATFLSMTFRENFLAVFGILDLNTSLAIFWSEIWYSFPLIFILFAHEMGHYIPSRLYELKVSLPYFIPFPYNPIGTMGAVIKIKEPIRNKIQLFDIGVGGPLMSLILSIPCWIVGIYLSKLVPIDPSVDTSNFLFFGDSLFTYWTGQWILGPYDSNLFDIHIHALAKAGWVGLLITAINLLPFGQLDGGHIIYAIFGEKYRTWIYYLFIAFLSLSLVNFGWLLWAFIIFYFIKIEHPFTPDSDHPRMGKNRKYLGYFMLLSLFFIFVPSPISFGTKPGEDSLLFEIWRFVLEN